jgi:RNA polymerase sigma factor (sigma-70 family)
MSVFRDNPNLLARFRAGDRDALETVYRAYLDKVADIVAHGFRIAGTGGAITGLGRHPADLADTVQEVFLKAFSRNARTSFDGTRDFGPYLGRIARNVMIDRARRSGRELLMPEVDGEVAGAAPSGDPYPDVVAQWEDPEAVAVARRFIAELPPELARIHHVLYVDGLSQRQASERLGISRQTLRTLEGKLREGLRQLLRQTAASPPVSAEDRGRRGSSPGLR